MQIFGIVSNRPQRNWTIALVLLCAVGAMSLPVSEPNYTVASVTTNNTNTTIRSSHAVGMDSIQSIANQLIQQPLNNNTVLDTRTPPKIKLKRKQKPNENGSTTEPHIENSHAGVAIPIEMPDEIPVTKRIKGTTAGGLSTWILLTHTTAKPILQTSVTPTSQLPSKHVKPMFKRKSTPAPTSTTTATTTTTPKQNTETAITTLAPTTTTISQIEAKDGDIQLASKKTTSTKRPMSSGKRKKPKTRRRKPGHDLKATTKVEYDKEKPISTQMYNYLSREIFPTVSAGLLGLIITAGLAGFYFYPFAAARRTFEVDRKDRGGDNYYHYAHDGGGMAEEEVIGKVIAGMPAEAFESPSPSLSAPLISARLGHSNYDSDVTPAVVPEHGPRTLRRVRRDLIEIDPPPQSANEILDSSAPSTIKISSTTGTTTTTTLTPPISEVTSTMFQVLRDIVHLKIAMGLQLVHNATRSFSEYLGRVQSRLADLHLQEYKNIHNRTTSTY